MAFEKKWQTPVLLADGSYMGEIFHVEESVRSTFNYLDIVIRVNTPEAPELTYSVPNTPNISPSGKLGRTLIACGIKFEEDKVIDVAQALQGKKVKFMVLNIPGKKNPQKKFANIVDDSITLI